VKLPDNFAARMRQQVHVVGARDAIPLVLGKALHHQLQDTKPGISQAQRGQHRKANVTGRPPGGRSGRRSSARRAPPMAGQRNGSRPIGRHCQKPTG